MTRFLLTALAAVLLTAAPGMAQPSIAVSPTLPAAPKLVLPSQPVAPALFSDKKDDHRDAPKADAAAPVKGYVAPAAAAVTVTVPITPNTSDCGSGFVVWSEAGKSYVVTNKHVVVGKQSPTALAVTVNTTRKTYPARFVDWSPDGDVALLELDAELPAVVLANDAAPAGTLTTHYGNTTGPQRGTITRYEETRTVGNVSHPWAGWISISTHQGASGDSGAGIYNDKGELVGVLWGGHPGQACAAPVGVVRRLLKTAVANRLPRLAARLQSDTAAVAANLPEPAPTAPAPKAVAPAPEPTKTAVPTVVKLYDVTIGRTTYRNLTIEQVGALFPGARFPDGTVANPNAAAGGTSFYGVSSFGSPCANGRCPQAR